MAAVNCLLSEDQFVCSICLNVFTDPVTTQCGHNFCKTCISNYWDKSNQCVCPLCKETFHTRPQLKINTLLSGMVSQIPQNPQEQTKLVSSEEDVATSEVFCDFCPGTKLKALKSCLVCLVSFCKTHLDPHLTVSALKHHQLINPVTNLEDRMCTKHGKPLELFCKTDQTFVCMHCTYSEHKNHDAVPLVEECEVRRAEVKQMIAERRLKIEKIQSSSELSQKAASQETAGGVEVFTALSQSVQRSLDQFKEGIEEKQRKKEKMDEELIKELEEEITQLDEKSGTLEQLEHSKDHLHFLQSFISLKSDSDTKDWTGVPICSPSFEEAGVEALFQLEKTLSAVLKKAFQDNLKTKQKWSVDLTLDPDTAQLNLVLSHGKKQVHYRDGQKNLPDNPERFSPCPCVLGKQSFSSGKFYFEVQVTGNTAWFLGVARESINRKGKLTSSPHNGFWAISLINGVYQACAGPAVSLSLKSAPQKVGVFVDYENGLVSFYDVDAAASFYSFTDCCFTDKLLPFFSVNPANFTPLKITQVIH